jgi:hypothetical protein
VAAADLLELGVRLADIAGNELLARHADNAAPREVFGSVARRLDAIGDEVRRQYEEKVL